MPHEKRSHFAYELVLHRHRRGMIAWQFRALGQGEMSCKDIVDPAMKRDRAGASNEQNWTTKVLQAGDIVGVIRNDRKAAKGRSIRDPDLPLGAGSRGCASST